MRKVAVIFIVAVFVPSLVLAWLAVRSLRDQQFALERQRSLLYQGATDALARKVDSLLADRLHEFGAHVEAMLTGDGADRVAASFDERLRGLWPVARVGFVVTPRGEIISPSANDRPEARVFRSEHGPFLGNRVTAEVYLNYKQAAAPISLAVPMELDQAAAPGVAVASAQGSALNYRQQSDSQGSRTRSAPVASPRKIVPQQLNEFTVKDKAEESQAVALQQQFSKIIPAEAEFHELIGEANEGTLARFVNNRLNLLLWYRSPRDARYIFGAQLDLDRIKDELRDHLPGFETALHEEICLAVLDDAAQPVALSHPDFQENWKRPFVATEIGELLPHWEVAAYLLNPAGLSDSARAVRLTLGLLILLLVLAIGTGSWLIVSDLNRQITLARQKTDFVSNVSHELKTPLTSIRMFSELLAEGRVTEPGKQRSYLHIIAAETARLTRLINNVLDFSRMERGEKKYEFRECDLGVIAQETAESYRPHLENNGFQLEADLAPGTLPVRGDSDALAQVIVNLLSNAEKYCNGRKEIGLQAAWLDGPLPCATVRIMDRGLGVPHGSEEKVFEKFYRAHDSLSSGIQGSGLGLTLARQIARAHGGDVVYERREGGGSCFSLRLPLRTEAIDERK